MTEVEHEPCPQCGEASAVAGRICPHCHGNLLVDLLSEPWNDARARYRAARAIAALGSAFPPFLETQKALSTPGTPVAVGLTRDQARQALRTLEAAGGTARIVASPVPVESPVGAIPLAGVAGEAERSFRSPLLSPWFAGGIVGAAAVLLVLMLFWPRTTRPPVAETSVPSGRTRAEPSEPAGLTTREIAQRTLDSTVTLRCGQSAGAGFFVTAELLLTNEHVLCPPGETLQVQLRDGRRLSGQVEKRDDWLDLALVRVFGAAAKPLDLGDATGLRPGDRVLAIGNPRGLDFSLASGIVSHSERNVWGIAYVQFDGNINPGNSGGPLLDSQGRAIGIVSMMAARSRGLALALPINYAYDGESALVPPPEVAGGGERWRSLLRRVKLVDQQEIQSASDAVSMPALASCAVTPEGDVVALVVSRGWRASGSTFFFLLRSGEQEVCSPKGVVEVWERLGSGRKNPTGDSRYLRWLQKNGIAREFWSGIAFLRWEGCPPANSLLGAELILQEGDPQADRVVLRSIEQRLVP